LVFPEGPRWRDGKLWFSDMHAHRVMRVDLDGRLETVVDVPQCPSGLGWLPDGRLLIVSMRDRSLLRLDPDGLALVADLSGLASFHCNDMVVDRQGRAYIGNFGFDLEAQPLSPKPAEIILVMPDGQARVVADQVLFPNGAVITPDGSTLIVGETFATCLTAFTIEPDGSLSERRVWAELGKGVTPDGICLDAEGAIWVTSPGTSELLRVREGGDVTHRWQLTPVPFACMLGGPDRQTLFILMAETYHPDEARQKVSGRIELMRVDVPGAGLP
jgi:sugar lactone lactonase YvrE